MLLYVIESDETPTQFTIASSREDAIAWFHTGNLELLARLEKNPTFRCEITTQEDLMQTITKLIEQSEDNGIMITEDCSF